MKNKIYLIILIMIIGVVGKCYGQLEIRIDNIRDSWVLGEDYLIKIHMKNTSDKVMKVIYSLESLDPTIRMDIEPKEGIKKERGLIIDRRPIKCPVASESVIGRYKPGWEHKEIIAISYFHILEKAGRYRIKLIYESKDYKRYSEIYEKIGNETIVTPISEVILGPVESNEIILEIKEPEGIDKQAYEEFKGYPRAYEKELLEKYPTSIYAGWVLLNYKGGAIVGGVFVRNDSAKKAILAAINLNSDEFKKWWHIDYPIQPYNVKETKDLMEKTELFVNAHSDFRFSGYLLAKAGFNALALSMYERACELFRRSLNLGWDLPQCDKKCMKPHIDGVEYALEILRENKICK